MRLVAQLRDEQSSKRDAIRACHERDKQLSERDRQLAEMERERSKLERTSGGLLDEISDLKRRSEDAVVEVGKVRAAAELGPPQKAPRP